MVVSLSKRTSFSMCLQSKAFVCVPVHWFGRTLICPGEEECPACKIGRKKVYWYTIATVNKRLEVVEMCDSLARTLSDFCYTLQRPTFRGIVARGSRPSKRGMWKMDELTLHEELVVDVSERLLIDAISQLYQLPFTNRHTDLRTWFDEVKKSHVPLLSKCVIPM